MSEKPHDRGRCADLYCSICANGEAQLEEPIPDELCEHAEMGIPSVGGFLFAGRTDPVRVGMCQGCLDWCLANLVNPKKLESLGGESGHS